MTSMREERFVVPFYLKMMRLNAIENADALMPSLIAASSQATEADIIALLRTPWRATVMGAWFSLTHAGEDVVGELLIALARSAGSLTSPPLAVAAVVLAGSEAVGPLQTYLAEDLSSKLGAAGFAEAAIEYLGAPVDGGAVVERDREWFNAVLAIAERLRATTP